MPYPIASLLALLACTVLLTGCPNSSPVEAKVDKLQAKFDILGQLLQKQDEIARAANPSTYVLTDYDRNQQICILATAHTISVGDRVFVGDDMWSVQAVKLFTGDLPESLRNPKTPKAYQITGMELLVKFEGKARQPTASPDSTPSPK